MLYFLKILLFSTSGALFFRIALFVQPRPSDSLSTIYILRIIALILISGLGMPQMIKLSKILFK